MLKDTKGKKQSSLAKKLTLRIAVALFAVFFVLIAVIVSSTNKDLVKRELRALELLSKENASTAREIMDTMLNKQEVIIEAVKKIDMIEEDRRADYLADLIDTVSRNEENILSLFIVAEPNTLLANSPNGLSIVTMPSGVRKELSRFTYVNEAIYKSALESKKMVIADPFVKKIDGKDYTVITVIQPIIDDNNRVIGMVGSNIDTEVLVGANYDRGTYESFQNEIICGHETVIIDSKNNENIGKPFANITTSTNPERILDSAAKATTLTILDKQKDGSKIYSVFVPFYVGDSTTPWLSGTSVSQKELNSSILVQLVQILIVCGIGFLLLALFCYAFINRMLKPIKQLESATKELSQGNLSVTTDFHSDDEVGRLSESFDYSIQSIFGYVKDIDRAMDLMARGDFNVYPEKPFIGDFKNIENSITNFIKQMCNTLVQISKSSDTVSCGANQLSEGSAILSQGAASQASSVEALSNAISLLAAQVDVNNNHAQVAGVTVKEAGEQLEISREHMQNMMKAITEMTRQSSEIGKIIKTIEDIAFQTNILALNAAVEAARAGAAGKGFAVVADEVRNLAGKSAEAAKSTTALIKNSISSVDMGAKIAKEASESLDNVSEKAAAIMEIVGKIADASEQQLERIGQVSENTKEITSVVRTNSATAEETAASSEELASQAQILKSLVSQFELNKMLTDGYDTE